MKWNKGEPPHIGWWYTDSVGVYKESWRWWDGYRWSTAVFIDDKLELINVWAELKTEVPTRSIKWSTYYPKNARVPRRKP